MGDNHRLGIVEHQFMLFNDLPYDFLGMFEIVVVADAKFHIDAALVVSRDVGDDVAPDFIVRHMNRLVVKRTSTA